MDSGALRCWPYSLTLSLSPTVLPQGKLALCACTHRFVTVTDDNRLVASSEKAREREILKVSLAICALCTCVCFQSHVLSVRLFPVTFLGVGEEQVTECSAIGGLLSWVCPRGSVTGYGVNACHKCADSVSIWEC